MGDTTDDALLRLAQAVRDTGYDFTTPTPATHARVIARPPPSQPDLRDIFGWSRPVRPDQVPPDILAAMHAAGVVVPAQDAVRSAVRIATLDGLHFLHSAYPTGAEDSVFFGPDTYRFARAIRARLDRKVQRAIDIGSGAGPGAILIARAFPEAKVFAADINQAALRLTAINARLNGVRVTPAMSNLLDGVPGQFDFIVSNPPYLVDPAARAYRHGGGDLGAGLSLAILDAALGRLAPGGLLILYTGAAIVNGSDPFQQAVAARLLGSGLDWTYEEVDPDVFGEELDQGAYTSADRIAAVVLTVELGS